MNDTRLAWLDQARWVAIVLMVVDHALVFLTPESPAATLLRTTVTRCAEPLFVFVMAWLVLERRHAMKWKRWLQIVALSGITSAILSVRLGYAMFDVLVSIAIVSPYLHWWSRMSHRATPTLTYLSGALAVIPLEFGGVVFDYSPLLLLYQVGVASWLRSQQLGHIVASTVVAMIATSCGSALGWATLPTLLIVLLGHPVAIAVLLLVRNCSWEIPPVALTLAHWPLTTYAGHLFILALLP